MGAVSFLDTNILIYAHDSSDPRKQRIARQCLASAIEGDFAISTQVLGEFASTLLHKLTPRLSSRTIREMLAVLQPIRTIATDAALVLRAVDAHARYGLHFYDGLIVAAAERAGCTRILSEDLSAGQTYFGVMVENPFATGKS